MKPLLPLPEPREGYANRARNKQAEGGMPLGFRELTVQNLVVPRVGDEAAAVLGPIQVGDKTGMALQGREGVELELERVGSAQDGWKANYKGRVKTQGVSRKDTQAFGVWGRGHSIMGGARL